MIALYIILGILLLLFLITLIRVQVFATYADDLTLTLKILFFKIPILPQKEKPKKPEKEKKPKEEKQKPEKKDEENKEKKPSFLSRLKDKKGVTGILSLFTSIARIAAGALKGLFSHIVIKKMDVGIALSGEDAASAAVNYGRVCSVLYPAVNIITAATVCEDYNVVVEPVFNPDRETEVYADVHLYLRIIWAIAEAVKAGVKLLIVRIRL